MLAAWQSRNRWTWSWSGSGVGGEEVAGRLAEAGLRRRASTGLVGGECPYWGCVPSKMMIRAANAAGRGAPGRRAGRAAAGQARLGAGREAHPRGGHRQLGRQGRGRPVHRQGRPVRPRQRPARRPGPGRGRRPGLPGPARASSLGTGTRPSVPPIDGLADTPYWTNHQAIEAEELPASLLVLGGGAIGLELAQVFARFGVRVTVVEAADRCSPPRSRSRPTLAAGRCARDGVTVADRGRRPSGSATTGPASPCTCRRHRSRGDAAAGRDRTAGRPGRAGPGHGRRGPGRALPRRWTTGCGPRDGIWAVGDVTGQGAFTHIAMYQAGIVVARHPRPGRPAGRLPGAAPGHLHRPGDRRGRADRAAGPRARHHVQVGYTELTCRPAAGSTRPATPASSSWSPTPTRACWSAPPRSARPAARCSPRWWWRCTRPYRSASSGT